MWFSLGNAYLRSGRFGDAASALERCLELDASREEALFNLALAYEQGGQRRNAVDAYRRYLSTNIQDERRRMEAEKRIRSLDSPTDNR